MKRRVWSRRVAAGHRVSAERHQRSAHSGRWQQHMRPKGERRLLPAFGQSCNNPRVGDGSESHDSLIKQPKMMKGDSGRSISDEMRSLPSRGGFQEPDQLFGKS